MTEIQLPAAGTSRRGFASMDPARRKAVASQGGTKTAETNDMAAIGRKGGQTTAQRGSEYFSRIGRIGGQKGRRGT